MDAKNHMTTDLVKDQLADVATALKSIEINYQQLYQNMFDSIIVYDYEHERILDFNDSAILLLGYSPEELFSKSRFDIISSESASIPGLNIHEEIRTLHREMVYAGDCIFSMAEVLKKDGEKALVKINVVPVGELSYYAFVVMQDMSKEIKQQRQLEVSQKRNRTILNNTKEAIVYFCLSNSVVIDCNNKVCDVFGTATQEEFMKTDLIQFYQSDLSGNLNADSFFKKMIKEVTQHKYYDSIYKARRQDGTNFIAEANAVYEGEGRPNAKVILFIRDITREYEAQQEMNRLFNQQKQILDSIPAPFLFKDLENNILACNKALAQTIDIDDPEKLVGKNLSEVLTKKEADRAYKEDMEMLKTGEPKVNTMHMIEHGKGDKIWYRNDKTPYIDENGNITGVLSYLVDVTELSEKNERLKKYIESNKQLDHFASIASHDLQAPLRTIISYTQLLNRRLKDRLGPEEEEFMQFIISATGNMKHLIDDLRNYSQVDSSKLNLTEFCMSKMINEIVAELKVSIDHVQAKILLPETMPAIKGDRIKMRQLFQNLISNALKYVENGREPVIQLSVEERTKHWHVAVKDNGIGIEPAYHQSIFELFRRLHSDTEYKGTGIGLSLCKKIVEQHQGTIGVSSKAGVGSTFYFTIAKTVKGIEDLF